MRLEREENNFFGSSWICYCRSRETGSSSFTSSLVGSGRSEESGNDVVDVVKVLISISKGVFDSGSDKAYPGF